MKSGQLCGIVASSKTRVRCIFCGVFIPKASRCIEQHMNGARHKDSYVLMNDNGISYTDGELHCKPCKRSLPEEDSIIKHIQEEEHSNWMAAIDDLVDGEFISLDAYLACERDDVFCEVCSMTLSCSLLSIEAHVNNIIHRTNITERLKPLNAIFTVNHGDDVWCKICDVYFDNTIENILSHIDDNEQHMEWFTEMEEVIEEQEVSIEAFLANQHETNVICKKCNMEVPCDLELIEEHVHCDSHLVLFGL